MNEVQENKVLSRFPEGIMVFQSLICLLDLYPWHIGFRNTAMFLGLHTMVLATLCLARAGVGEEVVTHINSNDNCRKNLKNLRDLHLIRTQHGSNDAKNIQLPSNLCFGIFFLHYSSFKWLT